MSRSYVSIKFKNTAINISKRYLLTLFLATAVGFMYFLPHLLMYLSTPNGKIYYPVSPSERLYGSQVKEIVDGHFGIGDPQLFEHKNTTSIFPYLPSYLLALLSLMTGSIINAFYLSDFLFPAILFILLVFFTNSLVKNYWLSVTTGIAVMTIYPLTTKFPPITAHLWNSFLDQLLLNNLKQPLPFYRTPSPQISFIILLIMLWSLYFLITRKKKVYMVITMIAGILLFYNLLLPFYFCFFYFTYFINFSFHKKRFFNFPSSLHLHSLFCFRQYYFSTDIKLIILPFFTDY